MAYATNSDLTQTVSTIMNHGVTDWTTQLTEAESDVNRWLEVNWYNKTFNQGFDQIGRALGSQMDATLLTDTQWTKATVYRALYAHILPTLSPFAVGGDTFREMIDFYRERFHEEMSLEMAKGVEYDADNDGTITRSEKHQHRQDRIYR